MMADQKNILFIVTDDQRFDTIHALAGKRTNLDTQSRPAGGSRNRIYTGTYSQRHLRSGLHALPGHDAHGTHAVPS